MITSRIISVFSGKGGVGKTTVASNLAAALSLKFNNSVIVVDCNITASHMGIHFGRYQLPINLNQVLRGEADIKDAIYDHYHKIKIIPASLSFKDLRRVDMSRLKKLMKKLEGEADFILLDTAPGLGREAMSVLRASKEVLFVSTPFVPSVADIIRCQEAIKNLEIKPTGLVLNMSSKMDELNKEDIEKLVDLPILEVIPMSKNILKSLIFKKPVVILKPNCRVSRKFYNLAAKIKGEEYKYSLLKFLKGLKKFK